jgi:hypothetical protein
MLLVLPTDVPGPHFRKAVLAPSVEPLPLQLNASQSPATWWVLKLPNLSESCRPRTVTKFRGPAQQEGGL